MSLPLVIGIGNPTRSDDGAGHAVVSGLAHVVPGGTYRLVHQLTPDLAEDVAEASLVVFVDASLQATTVEMIPVEPTPVAPGSHLTTAGTLLHLTELVYGRRPGAALQVAIPAYELGFGEELSPWTATWVGRAIARLTTHLDRESRGRTLLA